MGLIFRALYKFLRSFRVRKSEVMALVTFKHRDAVWWGRQEVRKDKLFCNKDPHAIPGLVRYANLCMLLCEPNEEFPTI